MTAPQASESIALLLVDDHKVVRAGLRTLLEEVDGLQIVGEAGTAAEAVSEANRLRPDVVLMDLRLPDGSGIDACREIVSAQPATRILFLTSHSDEEAVMSTVLAGAAGYLLKDLGHQALIWAILAVAQGQQILDAKAKQPVLEQMQSLTRPGKQTRNEADELSAQERRVLALVVEGKTNKEIAAALGLSDKTVKNYLSNAFQKLQVKRRSQAAALFSRRG